MNLSKSDQILEELAKKKSDQIRPAEEKLKIVVFTLGKSRYAFKGENVKEILPFSKISLVPGCPDFILGVINVRGDVESVIDINHILKHSRSDSSAKTRILIGENKNIRSGILVDSVEDVVDIDQSQVHHTVSTVAEDIEKFVVGEIEINHSCITVLDFDKILSEIMPQPINIR